MNMEHTFLLYPTDTLHVLGSTMAEYQVAHTASLMNDFWFSLSAFLLFVMVLFLIFRKKTLKNLVFRNLKLSAGSTASI